MAESNALSTKVAERQRTSKGLYRTILEADFPEQFIRTVPTQSIYLAVKHHGVEASSDLLALTSVEQTRLLLDLDLWDRDTINEEQLWQWLSLIDDDGDFSLLQKVLKSVDLKLVAWLISRYVEVVTFDEPTENPPAAGMHTPDKGYTWLLIKLPDANRHFLLARFMALLFETSAELFYQLLAIPGVATESSLEEEAYQEREKRLLSEGIPDSSFAGQLHSPPTIADVRRTLREQGGRAAVKDIRSVDPLVYDTEIDEPLRSVIQHRGVSAEEELSLIMNGAIVRYGVDFSEIERIHHLTAKVKGAITIGFAVAQGIAREERCDDAPLALEAVLGLQLIYRLGLGKLLELRALARKIPEAVIRAEVNESEFFSIVAGARELFPEAPLFFHPSGAIQRDSEGRLVPGARAIRSLEDVEQIAQFLRVRLAEKKL